MTVAQWSRWCTLCCTVLVVCVHATPNIVSVPDLHGDYDRAVQVLQAAGLIDPRTSSWSGGSTTLVQTGDIVDRGPDSQKIYKLFSRLASEAQQQGGAVINLLGNHELMNIQGDFRYVNDNEMSSVGGQEKWRSLWRPDAEIGQQVRKFKTAVKVGPVLFVHAGLMPSHLQNGMSLEELNKNMAAALAESGMPQHRSLQALVGDGGPLWTRFFASANEEDRDDICKTLSQVLKKVGAQRMVVGHTIQERPEGGFRVNAVCGGSLVLADTAISSAYGGEMSYVTYTADNKATVNYPRLGIQEVLPTPSRSPGLRLRQAGASVRDVPAADPWLTLVSSMYSIIILSVAGIIFLALVCLARPWLLQKNRPRK